MKPPFLTRARVNMVCHQAMHAGQYTLSAWTDVYLAFRTERQPDQLCEDVVACIVPSTTSNSPTTDYMDAAWRSLTALANTHLGAKIGRHEGGTRVA